MYPFYETISTKEPYGFTILFEENFNFPPHLHSYMEFVYILEGEMTVSVNEIRKDLKKGDISVSSLMIFTVIAAVPPQN